MNIHVDLAFCWVFGDTEPEAGLTRLRESGFEGIELWPDALQAAGAARWAQALRAAGMRAFQLCPYFDFVHGNEAMTKSRRMLQEYLDAAQAVDCRRLRVFTGPPWGEGVVGAREATAAQWHAAEDGLREFCDLADGAGVELCLECHEGSLMEDAPSALRLLHAVARTNLTTNLQLPLRDELWETSVAQLGLYTSHIHIHNWTGGLGRGETTFLDAGAFDWRPVLRRLAVDFGRPLCLSVEHAKHGGKDDAWETARRDGAFLRRLREELTT